MLRGSWSSPLMSLTRCAPAANAASMTVALRVSTETGTPALASCSITGTMRLISSPSHVFSAPGGWRHRGSATLHPLHPQTNLAVFPHPLPADIHFISEDLRLGKNVL